MDNNQIKQIINQTKDFYDEIAVEFSNTRKSSWKGWERLIEVVAENFKEKSSISILDLGCGNGRFYEFLSQNKELKFEYTGADFSEQLLKIGRQNHKKANFINLNILENINDLNKKYDLIVAFGLAHHIPDKEFRKNWFKRVSEKTNDSGLIIISFWNMQNDERFLKRAQHSNDLEENDYYYTWTHENHKRYTHIYTNEEITEIAKYANLGIKMEFFADGKSGDLNRYVVFKPFSL